MIRVSVRELPSALSPSPLVRLKREQNPFRLILLVSRTMVFAKCQTLEEIEHCFQKNTLM